MSPVTLGDLLTLAEQYFHTAARATAGTAGLPRTIHLLHCLVTVMERYLADVTPDDASGLPSRQDLTTTMRQAAGLRQLLRPAAAAIGDAAAFLGDSPPDRQGDALGQAATALSAGRDLLRSHHLSNLPRSPWAELLTTRPVITALTGEISRWSGRTTRFTAALAVKTTAISADAATALYEACGYLRAAADTAPLTTYTTGRDLLHAIPHALPPPRSPPGTDGIATTAERLRHAAFHASRQTPPHRPHLGRPGGAPHSPPRSPARPAPRPCTR